MHLRFYPSFHLRDCFPFYLSHFTSSATCQLFAAVRHSSPPPINLLLLLLGFSGVHQASPPSIKLRRRPLSFVVVHQTSSLSILRPPSRLPSPSSLGLFSIFFLCSFIHTYIHIYIYIYVYICIIFIFLFLLFSFCYNHFLYISIRVFFPFWFFPLFSDSVTSSIDNQNYWLPFGGSAGFLFY